MVGAPLLTRNRGYDQEHPLFLFQGQIPNTRRWSCCKEWQRPAGQRWQQHTQPWACKPIWDSQLLLTQVHNHVIKWWTDVTPEYGCVCRNQSLSKPWIHPKDRLATSHQGKRCTQMSCLNETASGLCCSVVPSIQVQLFSGLLEICAIDIGMQSCNLYNLFYCVSLAG